MQTPEEKACAVIDEMLREARLVVQDAHHANFGADPGLAIREFPLKSSYGFVDYRLFVDLQAVGIIEGKKECTALTGVEIQSQKYSKGLPDDLFVPVQPLSFRYQSTGIETRFTCMLDPEPGSRRVFHLRRPDTLATWIAPARGVIPVTLAPTLRVRLRQTPLLITYGLPPAQSRAIQNIEHSLAEVPSTLMQIPISSGKPFTASTITYCYAIESYGIRVVAPAEAV
jgi:type I restriction enzyme, R subunit